MVDTELRHRLSQDLRRLITGRMTNDEFDDVYYESYFDSDDLAAHPRLAEQRDDLLEAEPLAGLVLDAV